VRDAPHDGVRWVLREIGPSTLVAIHPDSHVIRGLWLDQSCLDEASVWAEAQSKAGFNVYFTANMPRQGTHSKPKKTDIEVLRCAAYADVDAKGGRTLNDCLDGLHGLPLEPSLVIASGGGFQPIWLLDKPLPATPENTLRVEAVSRAIAVWTGGDSVQNIDRILRVPFTTNYPNIIKRQAGRVACSSGILRSASQ
jgi:hypothetical protein